MTSKSAGGTAGVPRVAVVGATGRMGMATCRAINADTALKLVAMVARNWIDVATNAAEIDAAEIDAAELDVEDTGTQRRLSGTGLESLDPNCVDIIVDFSSAHVALQSARWCSRHKKSFVCGVSGIEKDSLEEMRELFLPGLGGGNCMVVPNFALGAVILDKLVELAAPYADSIEIIEMHHGAKKDAPSGTSIATAERIAAARSSAKSSPLMSDPTVVSTLEGSRGASAQGGVRIHSVRASGMVAHEEVLFGMPGQTLTIRHDSFNRESFMPGVLLALKAISSRPGLTLGLGPVLGL